MQNLKETKQSHGWRTPISSASFTTLHVNDANLKQVNGSSMDHPFKDGKVTPTPFYGSMGCQEVVKLFYGASHPTNLVNPGLDFRPNSVWIAPRSSPKPSHTALFGPSISLPTFTSVSSIHRGKGLRIVFGLFFGSFYFRGRHFPTV